MTSEQIQGLIDAPFNEPDYTEQYIQDDAMVFSTGKAVVIADEPVKRFDGQLRRVHTTKSPIFDETGAVVMMVAICHDITERMQLEAQVRLGDRMATVGTLAAGVAHEINTPVQFVSDSLHFLRDATCDILGLLERLEGLQRQVLSGVPAADLLGAAEATARLADEADMPYLRENIPTAFERCLDGLERVSTIVSSMKEFAHPAQNEMAAVDLNRSIANTLSIARNEYKYVAELETEFGELPPVVCHINEINQVVLNIVVNAAHAIGEVVQGTEKRGTITVCTRREGDHVVVSITDTGVGIPETNAHRVFEPFFTTKPVGKGTGQGLALAWAAVKDKHAGELTFKSTIGVGTTFFMRLPINGKQLHERSRREGTQ